MRYGVLLLLSCLLSGGCAVYRFGPRAEFCADVNTVFVPIFRSDTLYRNIGERLSEAVIKEIHLRTPYRVITDPNADSTLRGRVILAKKSLVFENRFDDPRGLAAEMVAEVSWNDRAGNPLMQRVVLPLSDSLTVGAEAQFLPESGESLATAQQRVIDDLARQIVSEMEKAW